MTVWLVLKQEYSHYIDDIIGVFSTEEKAEEVAHNLQKVNAWYDFKVEERIVD